MHRERIATETIFDSPNHTPLFTLTTLLAMLLFADLAPLILGWLNGYGWEMPIWERSFAGYRYALIAAMLGGARILYGSLESLMDGRLGADLALAIACIAAILVGEPLVAAEVVFIGLIGECLEAFVFARTQRSVGKLIELFPRRCWRLRDGELERIFTDQLVVGDVVVVKPGGKIPVDGLISAGVSSVNVRALTGESLPIDKQVGDTVLAGSINQLGALTIEATQLADQTVAGRVIAMTGTALREKATLERTADRLARYFLPVVLGLAVVTFLANLAIYAGPFRNEATRLSLGAAIRLSIYPTLSVLVVACPCALILATPAAVIATLGRLAGTGVLIRRAAALERLAVVDVIAFDKTGTLTEGQLEISAQFPLHGLSANELLTLAATAEQGSEHPVARAIVETATQAGLKFPTVERSETIPGGGVIATTATGTLLVGNRRWLIDQGIVIPASFDASLTQLDAEGQTAVLVVGDGTLLGALGLRDRLRPEAAGVIDELRELGIDQLWMLSGDRLAVAQAIAKQLPQGITVEAELWPPQKAERIQSLLAGNEGKSRNVMMVGDGINDAPALASASVGIAIGSTDLVVESGDVLMMGEPLRPLPFLVRLSRQMLTIMRQNILIFGFGVNLVGVIVIAWLWPFFAQSPEWFERGPLFGAIYHQFGSLLVLLNSMRLLTFERESLPLIGSVSGRFAAIDRWIGEKIHVGEWLHELAHRWRTVAASVFGLALLIWAISGVIIIQVGELGLVSRFGRITEELPPGLNWRYPWPIERVERIRMDAIRTVEIGFRNPVNESNSGITFQRTAEDGTGLTWASAHAEGVQRIAEESILITGDGNLVELLATVRYSITNARQYRTSSIDPEALIRAQSEMILRAIIASRPFLDLLTVQRSAVQSELETRLSHACETIVPGGIGIRLDGVTLHDLHPPQEVVPAYHEVARAIQSRDRAINDAKADASRLRGRAQETATMTTRNAQAAAHEKTQEATAARDAFLGWSQSRRMLARSEESAWVTGMIGVAGSSPFGSLMAITSQPIRDHQLIIRRGLTEFRLASEVMIQWLRKRDKILIDSDRVPGKRSLWLIDPEILRNPPSMMTPNPLPVSSLNSR